MPQPQLAEDEEEQADDQPTETPEEETMPEPDDPEEELEDELDDENEEQEEQEEEQEEEEEVAEATMPDDDDETPSDDESSGGILSKLPTRLIIVGSAIAIAGVLVLWFLRGGSGSPQERAQEAEQAAREHQTNEEGGMEYTAPPDQPLERDAEMMGALGLGDGMGQ